MDLTTYDANKTISNHIVFKELNTRCDVAGGKPSVQQDMRRGVLNLPSPILESATDTYTPQFSSYYGGEGIIFHNFFYLNANFHVLGGCIFKKTT